MKFISNKGTLSRRTLLRGLGATLALPALEAMSPIRAAAAAASSRGPLRMAFLYIPNGVNMKYWAPEGTGRDFKLNRTMEALNPYKEQFQILSGLAHDKAYNNGDGAGDHARANATFLTGMQARKTAGSDIEVGISVDQIAAQAVGKQTYMPSLELSADHIRTSGRCDSGYSCAYQFNLAWRTPSMPLSPDNNPRSVFERLFGSAEGADRTGGLSRQRRYQRSVLDVVLEDARSLERNLPAADRRKLDEYLTAVRETERRIEKAEEITADRPDTEVPAGIPEGYADYLRVMFDLQVLAFQTDTTRISTFLLAHDGSNRSFREIGVPDGHHYLSHHQNNGDKLEQIAKIDKFYCDQLAYFLKRMSEAREGEHSVLDNSMVVYGGGISCGNRHTHSNLPVILAGGGAGTLTPGRHVEIAEKTPMTNLYISMLDRMGVEVDEFGDSTGKLEGI